MRNRPDNAEEVVIPLDPTSIVRLARLGRITGRHPTELAASLLHDLLLDDELANAHPRLSTLNS